MALDTQNNNIAYLGGRLVAVLHEAEVLSGGIQTRLTTEEKVDEVQEAPNTIIGSFLGLRHIMDGVTEELDEIISEIMDKVPADGFPRSRFSPEDWTMFWIGYQHQRGALTKQAESR